MPQISTVVKIISTLASALISIFNLQNEIAGQLTVPGEIQKAGYPVELHSVTTEDGYILGVHRIPYSPKSPDQQNKPVVLLKHGLFTCSSDWIILGPDKALSYMLADLGYDVWLGNSRGNTYSRNHTKLNPDKDKEFWNYSFHEQGVYDIPATIDYILKLTGQQKLFYMGHSQGTTEFFVMASERPEYNDKIRAMFSLAPALTQDHSGSPALQIMKNMNVSFEVENMLGIREFLQHDPLYYNIAHLVYQQGRVVQIMAETSIYITAVGFDFDLMDTKTLLPELAKKVPAGASTKQCLHFYQGFQGKFGPYDYGRKGNLLRYGTKKSPEYNVSKITAPIALHISHNDWAQSSQAIERLYSRLVNPIGKFVVPYPNFNHFDYLFANNVRELLYNKIVDLMKSY